jgi:hypothetical protein
MRKLVLFFVFCSLIIPLIATKGPLPAKDTTGYTPVSVEPEKYFRINESAEPKDPSIVQISNVVEVVPPMPIPSEDNTIKKDRQAVDQPQEIYRVDPDSYEPDNNYWEATTLIFNAALQSQYHTFHTAGDIDRFGFSGVQGVRYVFFSTQPDAWANPRISILNAYSYSTIAQDDNSGLNNGFFLEFTPTTSDPYLVMIDNTSGMPGAYYLHYTNGTPADDYENDNTSAQATNIFPDGFSSKQLHTLNNSSDLDWFRFNAQAGTTYHFYTTGSTDTYGRIYAANGTTVVALDDDGGVGLNFSISYTCTTTGTYFLQVNGYGGATGFYFLNYNTTAPADAYEPDDTSASSNYLSVTALPQTRNHTLHTPTDVDWFRFYAYTGRRYVFYTSSYVDPDIILYDDALNQIYMDYTVGDFLMYFVPTVSSHYRFRISSFGAPFAYQLTFYYEFDADSYEPDNTSATATNIATTTNPQTQNHTLHNGYDQDWYRFEGIPGRLYFFYSTGSTDTQIYLYADDGTTQLGFNDDSGEGLNFRLEFAPATYGYYKIKVIPYPGNAGPYGFVYYYGATPDAYEPDNTYSVSTTLIPTTVFQSQPHTLHNGTDEDWFIFYAYAGRTYTIYSSGNTDVRAYIYNADVTQFGFNDDGAGYPNFLLQYYITNPGLIYIKVNGYNGAVGAYDINYNYTMGAIAPPMLLSIVLINNNTIYLDWPNVTNATGYRVEGSDNPYSGFVPVANVTSSSWSTTLTYAKKYYRVIAYN